MVLFLYFLGIMLGFSGLSIASYIHGKKISARPMVCPVGSNCEVVVHSEYSKLFRTPLETIGAFYYFFIILSFSLLLSKPGLNSPLFTLSLLEITGLACIFSL